MRVLTAVFVCLALLACSPRGTLDIKPAASEIGSVQEILVATNRAPADSPELLSSVRSNDLRYFDFAVSVPPARTPGSVVFPGRDPPDPERHFLATSAAPLPNTAAFVNRLNERLRTRPRTSREVTVFVHGFNTTFAEGLYRHAQIAHDFGTNGVSVNFAWPSAGSARQYATDRETVLFARDGLEAVLLDIAGTSAERVVIAAHSMGAHLVMETLRQMDIRGNRTFFDRLASVVLMAPDIDLDIFLLQSAALKKHDIPIYVFTSGDDRALRLSSRLRGGAQRLGAVRDPTVFDGLPVFLVDLSDVQDGRDTLLHSKAASSPTVIGLVNGMGSAGLEMFRDEERRLTIAEAGIVAIQGAGDAVSGLSGLR
jgi:esterase/lipase superfamily enzyme